MSTAVSFPPASLAVVALPLGNLGDVTPRALEVLRCADWVAAEDTRTVGRLLASLDVRARLLSYHDWNEAQRAPQLLAYLQQGARVALVAEAGTPGISDPGYDIVSMARHAGVRVFPVPGPSALIAFLSASGLPTDRFTFLGFPPRKTSRLRTSLEALATRPETLVFYESPRRILTTLEIAHDAFGPRLCALGRELTKPYEEFFFGPLPAVREALAAGGNVRGEICWGVAGADPQPSRATQVQIEAAARAVLQEDLPAKQAARNLAAQCGISVKEAYAVVNALKDSASA